MEKITQLSLKSRKMMYLDLLVDVNKSIIFEDACITLKTPLFSERINCNQTNTLKFDSLVGFYTNQNGNEIYLEQRDFSIFWQTNFNLISIIMILEFFTTNHFRQNLKTQIPYR